MLFENIKIGNRVEIAQDRDVYNPKSHISQVENKLKDGKVIVHAPISYGEIIKLPTGNEYQFLFYTERGIIYFKGIVEKQIKEDGFSLILVQLFGKGERIQRRAFFRFACSIPLQFFLLDSNTLYEIDAEPRSAITKNIGGGGVCFLSNDSIEEKKIIMINIKLDREILSVIGEILQKSNSLESNYRYQYRVNFVGINSSEQEKIVQYIFNEQKKVLQKVKNDNNNQH